LNKKKDIIFFYSVVLFLFFQVKIEYL